MIETILRDLRQPEYVHVLINPLPVYGLAVAWIALIVALLLKSRPAQIAALVIVFVSSAAAWPVFEYGQQAEDRVESLADADGQAWLAEHKDRAEDCIYFFYALALLSAVAIVAPMKWPKSATLLALASLLLATVDLGVGGYIGYAGGKIRHREFRNEPPPKIEHKS